jgi:hypothetical protein
VLDREKNRIEEEVKSIKDRVSKNCTEMKRSSQIN